MAIFHETLAKKNSEAGGKLTSRRRHFQNPGETEIYIEYSNSSIDKDQANRLLTRRRRQRVAGTGGKFTSFYKRTTTCRCPSYTLTA